MINIKYHSQFLLDKEKGNKESAKLRYRIKWHGNIVAFNVGYRVEIAKWSTEVQRCKNNTLHGKKKIPANIINRHIQQFENACDDIFTFYSVNNSIPTQEQFRQEFNKKVNRRGRDNIPQTFFECFDLFLERESLKNQWAKATKDKFKTLRQNLESFKSSISFADLTEEWLIDYQLYLQDVLLFRNSTVLKMLSLLRWFLRWATRHGYNTNMAYAKFSPSLKSPKKGIVFLTQEELRNVIDCEIPPTQAYLEKIRDVFLFQCFTGLRFSDVRNLKRSDIFDDHLEIVSVKTHDRLIIELNLHSRDILDKYSGYNYPNNNPLPVISNQKTNKYLKELMQLAGIDSPVRYTYYIGNKRIDEEFPKYKLIGTHTGRRTFICTALGLGIPPQVVMKWTGHSNYQSMKPYIDIADNIKIHSMEKFNLL